MQRVDLRYWSPNIISLGTRYVRFESGDVYFTKISSSIYLNKPMKLSHLDKELSELDLMNGMDSILNEIYFVFCAKVVESGLFHLYCVLF